MIISTVKIYLKHGKCQYRTHHFLYLLDFEEINSLIRNIDFNTLDVYCGIFDGKFIGFIDASESKKKCYFFTPNIPDKVCAIKKLG